MGLIALNCPSCGAQLNIDENRDFLFCEFCGTRVEREKTIIEHTGTVKLEGVADADKLLERAFILIESGNFEKADDCLDKVLSLDPKCAKAYMGELLCQLKLKDMEQLRDHIKPLDKFSNYNYALQFSENDEKQRYKQYNIGKKENYERFKQEKAAALEEKYNLLNNNETEFRKKENKMRFFKKLCDIKFPICIFLFVIIVVLEITKRIIDTFCTVNFIFDALISLIFISIIFLFIYPKQYVERYNIEKDSIAKQKIQIENEKTEFDRIIKQMEKQE